MRLPSYTAAQEIYLAWTEGDVVMLQLRNYMEVCVTEMMDSVLRNLNSCTCENCRYDIAAIALNHLPPKYAVTREGNLYSKLNLLQQQFDVDIITQITKAAEIVSRNPRHQP